MRFRAENRTYDLVGRDVFFGVIHVGTLPDGVCPQTPEEAVKAWISRNISATVISLADYKRGSFQERT